MPQKKCALRKGVTKWPILEESVANWVLENRLNELIVTRNSVRLFALKWSKKNAFLCYPAMKVHKKNVAANKKEKFLEDINNTGEEFTEIGEDKFSENEDILVANENEFESTDTDDEEENFVNICCGQKRIR
ncbi:hypothetical protein TNCV_377591 [Trichonephila clavipes]|nr:hypothetical protein TNCV_377591 [Trichonephila clavipes]